MILYLIGFMGCGKTTLGQKLSIDLALNFCDLDREIERQTQMTIPEIFAKHGEEWFRNKESEILSCISKKDNLIISCGGGAPCFHNNMATMLATGKVIYLHAKISILFERLKKERATRPLLAKLSDTELLEYIENSLQYRTRFYNNANTIIDVEMPYIAIVELIKKSGVSFIG